MVRAEELRKEEMCRHRVEMLHQGTLLLGIVLNTALQQRVCLSLSSLLTVLLKYEA
jgi:hypothetical protein